ncbi:MAG: hypothetical protein E7554_00445 [Ruminococcaceae bacterium]|nr:hypothetical protein [Oscillospiraceae bacterium]
MAKKSRVANVALNTTAGVASRLTGIICNFVMRTVFIHTLGIAYTGVSSLFTDVLTMLSFAELGISSAITYALYKPMAQGDTRKIAMLMNFYKSAYRKVALAVLAGGLCLLPVLKFIVPIDKIDSSNPALQEQIYGQLYIIYVLYVINSAVSYLLVYKSALLTAKQEYRYASFVQIAFYLIRMAVECALLFTFKSLPYCFIIYLVVNILLTRLQNYVVAVIADRHNPGLDEYRDEKLPKDEQSKLFKNIGALMIYKVSSAINASLDSIVISAMFGTIWVGLVSNYRMVTTNIQKLLNQFYNSVTSSVGNLAAQSGADKQYRSFRTLFFLSFWMLCFCSTSFIVLLNPFVEIWLGAEYVKSMYLVVVLVVSAYFSSVIHPISTFRSSNGLFVQGKFRPVAMLVINVGLSVVLAVWLGSYGAEWGIVGIKLATIISSLLTLQWYDPWVVYRNVFNRSVSEYFRRFALYFLVTAGCAALTYFLGTLVPADIGRTARFLILCLLCVVIPNAVVIVMFRKTEEFGDICAILGRIKSKLRRKAGSRA